MRDQREVAIIAKRFEARQQRWIEEAATGARRDDRALDTGIQHVGAAVPAAGVRVEPAEVALGAEAREPLIHLGEPGHAGRGGRLGG